MRIGNVLRDRERSIYCCAAECRAVRSVTCPPMALGDVTPLMNRLHEDLRSIGVPVNNYYKVQAPLTSAPLSTLNAFAKVACPIEGMIL